MPRTFGPFRDRRLDLGEPAWRHKERSGSQPDLTAEQQVAHRQRCLRVQARVAVKMVRLKRRMRP